MNNIILFLEKIVEKAAKYGLVLLGLIIMIAVLKSVHIVIACLLILALCISTVIDVLEENEISKALDEIFKEDE